ALRLSARQALERKSRRHRARPGIFWRLEGIGAWRITGLTKRHHAPYLKTGGKKNTEAALRTFQNRETLLRRFQAAGHVRFDAYDLAGFEQEIAGILDSPFDVGHVEFRLALPGFTAEFGVHQRRDFVLGPVHGKRAVNSDVGRPA